MKHVQRTWVLCLLMVPAALLPACNASGQLGLEPVVTGLNRPLFLTSPPGDTNRLFIIEQAGVIRVVENGTLLETPFLDLSGVVDSNSNEEGLLGMAFHPDYMTNGLFYVNYTTTVGGTSQQIVEYSVLGDPATSNVADPSSDVPILALPKPQDNHNAGMMAFGPNDGMLYISTGDGGGANDPLNSGQSLNTLLGKVLRLDVSLPYPHVPADNPFVGLPDHEERVWAYGLRNPWRFSFDRDTGDLFIGDVGQGAWEEIDFQPASSTGGENYGWRVAEGFQCRGGGGTCGTNPGFTPPIHALRTNVDGDSIVGGYVYRGNKIANLNGTYFFADSGFSRVWSFRYDPDTGTMTEFQERTAELESGGGDINHPSSFGEDAEGNLYILNLNGTVYRITGPAPEFPPNIITANLPQGFIEEGARLVLTAPEGSGYVWKKDGVEVTPDGGRISGLNERDLVFDPVLESDEGVYTCEYENGAEFFETEPYVLEVLAPGSLPVLTNLFAFVMAIVLATGGLTALWLRR